MDNSLYCNNLFNYSPRKTSEVQAGNIKIGGDNPIRLQSMTNTNTSDIEKTLEQSIRIYEAGGEIVRYSARGVKEIEKIAEIVEGLNKKGCQIPTVADIHFNPKAAFAAAKVVDKVRINPGNFIDKRASFEKTGYSEEEYNNEVKKINDKLIPLIILCKENSTALRIGINHGSLSDRIMSKYGNTPLGMVESALEFLRICVNENFYNIVISIKSSNTRVMVHANRMLINRMLREKMNFPIHLGVTEAGEGEDGRIKSAVGIGAMLNDGIGDTIRVSLTEAPEKEIPVAKKITEHYIGRENHEKIIEENLNFNPFEYYKQINNKIKNVGGENPPIVVWDLTDMSNSFTKPKLIPDYIFVDDNEKINDGTFRYADIIVSYNKWLNKSDTYNVFPIFSSPEEFIESTKISDIINFVSVNDKNFDVSIINTLNKYKNIVLVFNTLNIHAPGVYRSLFFKLKNQKSHIPVIIKANYSENNIEDFQLKASCDTASVFLDGFADGLWLSNNGNIENVDILQTTFGILQASRVRMSKTEYISCPGCGRTLFDIQTAVKRIREKTSHLKNLKIGIMGCIVNGPGEMADADYGYVGAGVGKISLYKNKKLVKKNIPENDAIKELINLIKKNGDWKESDN
ncbi:MAG: (E)-4-hydroxy-3-methylbut-2-enyl-diphosphate synthase [Bacteroidales bacterium]|jgi:(E)-4-hydroxy-3-methylbut-2-enyl-diphosphate synthase|nr:(E)-4-hydroxy-3-methylbut-2-enyl-diphosphate synthase [Bacteroidales bacterium]